jgi:hypothetical protein
MTTRLIAPWPLAGRPFQSPRTSCRSGPATGGRRYTVPGAATAGFGLGRIWGGLPQHLKGGAAPRLLPGVAERGQEYRDQYGWEPDPLHLTSQDSDTRWREEGAHPDRRNANRTPGEEMPANLNGCEEGHPEAPIRQSIQDTMRERRQEQEAKHHHTRCLRRLRLPGAATRETRRGRRRRQ